MAAGHAAAPSAGARPVGRRTAGGSRTVTGMFGRPALPTVDAAELARDRATVTVLDVREDDEWTAGHIDGALHVPLMDLPQRLPEVPADAPVVVVCRVGSRSAQATAWLAQQGYDVRNLDGGMVAWFAAGLPAVAEADAAPVVL